MEISNLPDAKYKTLFMRMLKELRENLSSIQKTQAEIKDTLIEIKNNLQGNDSRVGEARTKSMIWNIRKQKTTMQNNKKKKDQKNEDSISSLWDTVKRSNICIIGVPEGEEKEQEIGNISEKIVKENFPNLVKEIDIQVQEAQSPKQDGCKEAHIKIHHN